MSAAGGLVTITTPWLGLSFRCARCLLQNFHLYFLLELSLLSSAKTICQLLSYLSQIRPSEGPNSCIPLARIVEFNPKYSMVLQNMTCLRLNGRHVLLSAFLTAAARDGWVSGNGNGFRIILLILPHIITVKELSHRPWHALTFSLQLNHLRSYSNWLLKSIGWKWLGICS